MKIQLFDILKDEIFKNIFQFWRKNSNMSKSKVLSKFNFLNKNLTFRKVENPKT